MPLTLFGRVASGSRPPSSRPRFRGVVRVGRRCGVAAQGASPRRRSGRGLRSRCGTAVRKWGGAVRPPFLGVPAGKARPLRRESARVHWANATAPIWPIACRSPCARWPTSSRACARPTRAPTPCWKTSWPGHPAASTPSWRAPGRVGPCSDDGGDAPGWQCRVAITISFRPLPEPPQPGRCRCRPERTCAPRHGRGRPLDAVALAAGRRHHEHRRHRRAPSPLVRAFSLPAPRWPRPTNRWGHGGGDRRRFVAWIHARSRCEAYHTKLLPDC